MSDLTGKLIGWREWDLAPSGVLLPTGVGGAGWEKGPNTATCRFYDEHKAPDHDCECGLYARYDPTLNTSSEYSRIAGVVLAWGAVELHHDGFRAEHAEILCIVCSLDSPVLLRMVAEHVADHYGVPVLSRERAAAHAAEFGRAVPPELVPEEPEEQFASSGTLLFGGQATGNSFYGARFASVPGFVRAAQGLAPRPTTVTNFNLSNSRLRLASGVTMGNGSLTNCFIESAEFHPGKVAWGLLSLGGIAGALLGLCAGFLW